MTAFSALSVLPFLDDFHESLLLGSDKYAHHVLNAFHGSCGNVFYGYIVNGTAAGSYITVEAAVVGAEANFYRLRPVNGVCLAVLGQV